MNCVTASYPRAAGVTGSCLTEKEQKFVSFSFYHNPPCHYLESLLFRLTGPGNLRRSRLSREEERYNNRIKSPRTSLDPHNFLATVPFEKKKKKSR